jgi:hypothetical protein
MQLSQAGSEHLRDASRVTGEGRPRCESARVAEPSDSLVHRSARELQSNCPRRVRATKDEVTLLHLNSMSLDVRRKRRCFSGRCAVSATIWIDRFHCADNYLISVSQEHVNEPEAGSFEQADPSRDRHVVSNAIGMAGAQ